MENFLITGGAGFIGSNFIPYFLEKYPDYFIVNLDLLTYAGNLDNLKEVENHPRYQFIKGDICDRPLIEKLFNEFNFKGVFHFAAESHVDNSIAGPEAFIRTNVMGTFTVLDVARKKWMESPFGFNIGKERNKFLHISTDEVFGSLGKEGYFTETTPYAPNSPYSASKASSDFLVRSYFHTYGMNVVTTNCSNNYGPKQHGEKLIPTIIRTALAGRPIPIYGDGLNVRDWLYVLDHCKGVDMVWHSGESGETYNIGGQNERTNLEIVNMICDKLDLVKPLASGKSYKAQISFVKDRAGHDRRYAIDATKIERVLGWQTEDNFDIGIQKTIGWYLA